MVIKAKWSYSTRKTYTGKVTGTTEDQHGIDRLAVVPNDSHGGEKVYIKPGRLDNTDEVLNQLDNESIESDNNQGDDEIVDKLPEMSTRKDGKWVGLNEALEPMTEKFDSHKALKNYYDVDGVKGSKSDDGQKYYDLAYTVEKRKEVHGIE